MPQQRMDIRTIKDILRLKYQGGLSHERIAQSLSISKGAVAMYLSLARAAGLDWATTAELDEASLERRLMDGGAAFSRAIEPDYARVHNELRRKGVRWCCCRRNTALQMSAGAPGPTLNSASTTRRSPSRLSARCARTGAHARSLSDLSPTAAR